MSPGRPRFLAEPDPDEDMRTWQRGPVSNLQWPLAALFFFFFFFGPLVLSFVLPFLLGHASHPAEAIRAGRPPLVLPLVGRRDKPALALYRIHAHDGRFRYIELPRTQCCPDSVLPVWTQTPPLPLSLPLYTSLTLHLPFTTVVSVVCDKLVATKRVCAKRNRVHNQPRLRPRQESVETTGSKHTSLESRQSRQSRHFRAGEPSRVYCCIVAVPMFRARDRVKALGPDPLPSSTSLSASSLPDFTRALPARVSFLPIALPTHN